MNIIVDTGFWIALYDGTDEHHTWANQLWDELSNNHKFIVPYPTMYEFINTRLMRRKGKLFFFKELFNRLDTIIKVSDECYKEDALRITFETENRDLSLVDNTIRLMIEDEHILKHAVITTNVGDFSDVCRKKRIQLISQYDIK